MKHTPILISTLLLATGATLLAQKKGKKPAPPTLQFRVQQLHKDNNEGIAVGDINGDGALDITSGEFWYEAPDFKKHPVRKLLPFGADYLQNNGEHLYDMDGDGDLDIIGGPFTLPIVNWFENPGAGSYDAETNWTSHQLVDTGTDKNEASFLHDIDGDGTLEWFENSWVESTPVKMFTLVRGDDGTISTKEHLISTEGDAASNGHGMGFGDINGDGRDDIIFKYGWYEHPAEGARSGPWELHRDFTLPHASCPILVLDLNGDGRNDLIWADGHSYGLYWEEQLEPQSDGTITLRQHLIDKKFSQAHTMAWADLDNDDQPELITGKRYYAHSGRDAGAADETTVHYYDWNPTDQTWKKNWISKAPAGEGPGVGLQIRVVDLDEDGWKDVVVPGKSGTHIIWNEGWTKAR